ncbi:MAG: hypothetical protein IPH05_11920 [Flavobacteriales bacterium]|nr:hypothetical protein [Flavobacteriales bacterium]
MRHSKAPTDPHGELLEMGCAEHRHFRERSSGPPEHPECFDLILVDAPCSGEGMFRKDAYAREQWSPELVDACARTQSSILDHALVRIETGVDG